MFIPLFLSNCTPVSLHMLKCSCAHILSCLVIYSSFAGIGHAEIMWFIVSSNCWRSLHLLSVSVFNIFFTYFVCNAWSCAATISLSVSAFRSSFDSQRIVPSSLISCLFIFLMYCPCIYYYYCHYYYYYYYYYTIWMSVVTGLFFLVLLLNQRWSPPLRLQTSRCSTFCITCDVSSIAVFCSETIKRFSGTAPKFFLKILVTIPVAPFITGIIAYFRFHIRCISIYTLLYFNFFSASFAQHFCLRVLPHLPECIFSLFLFLVIISGLFVVTSLTVCTAWFHNTVTSPSSYTGLSMCVYHLSVVSTPKALSSANVYKLYLLSLNIRSSPKWGTQRLSGQ